MARMTEKSGSLPFRQTAQKILQYGVQLRQPQLPQEKQKTIAAYNALNGRYKDSILQYLWTHADTDTAGVLALCYFFDIQKDSGFLRRSLQLMQDAKVDNPYTHYISDELDGLDSAHAGKVVPGFSLVDRDNKVHHFPDGHKTLLVFWASWCVPCRAENSALKDQYAKIRQKGIAICGVNLDEDKNRWLLASGQDGLPWLDCFAGNAFASRIARFFTLHQIPQNVLLDENGKILARNSTINQLIR